jgi:hypothetical protein
MRKVLCIVSSTEDSLARAVISKEEVLPDCSVEIYDLHDKSDYDVLLDKIIEADSVQVW